MTVSYRDALGVVISITEGKNFPRTVVVNVEGENKEVKSLVRVAGSDDFSNLKELQYTRVTSDNGKFELHPIVDSKGQPMLCPIDSPLRNPCMRRKEEGSVASRSVFARRK